MPKIGESKVQGLAPPMRTADLFAFMQERHNVYLRKTAGRPKPWTTHPALRQFRFTNVYRELDTVTVWIRENWREPHREELDLWFALVVARLVNWPDTLGGIGYPVPWRPDHFVRVLEARKERREKVFTGAYMVRADCHFNGSKAAYLAEAVLGPMWRDRAALRRIRWGTLAQAHRTLRTYRDMGSFIAAQVICDLKHTPPLDRASDWWTWAASGPGSRRGLNRVVGRPKDAPWKEPEWFRCLQALHKEITPLVEAAKMPPLHGQDLQSCLCEWDKAERFRLKEGRPKAKYPGWA